MARNRMIKVEYWSDEKLAVGCSRDARLLYIGMWNYSDDFAVIKGHPVWLKSQIFPYDDDLDILKFKTLLTELQNLRRILPFQVNGEQYFYIVNFPKHQKINNPSARINPKPPQGMLDDIKLGLPKDSRGATVGLPKDSRLKGKGEGEREGKGNSNTHGNTSTYSYYLQLANSKKFIITKEFLEKKIELYPSIDVKLQLERMNEWFDNDPAKLKSTERGIKRFITNWLKREKEDESKVERNYNDIPERLQR